jgi:putative flippase GtrA
MIYAIGRAANGRETGRWTRYLVVGSLSTVVDFGVVTVLKALGLPTVLANSLSFSIGTIVSFTLNRSWTYSDSRSKGVTRQFAQFLIVSVCGLLLNTGIVLVLTSLLDQLLKMPAISYIPAKIAATGLVFAWNIVMNRLWTFNDVE